MDYLPGLLPTGQVALIVTCSARKTTHPRETDGTVFEPWVMLGWRMKCKNLITELINCTGHQKEIQKLMSLLQMIVYSYKLSASLRAGKDTQKYCLCTLCGIRVYETV